jgi:O-antigen/teichoic acid export membrane protein
MSVRSAKQEDPGPISDPATNAANEPELIDLVKRGLRWSFTGMLAVRIGTFSAGLVMARVLSPHDYGIYTVGAVALLLTASINDIGIEPTLVRWPGKLKEVAPTAATIVMTSSVLLFGAFWFFAPEFSRMLNAPGATNIVRFMSVGIIISGAFTVPSAINAREFRQHVRMIGEVGGTIVTIGLTLTLGLAGFGPLSLAVGHIAGNLTVGLVLFIGSPSHFRPGWNTSAAKRLIVLGLPLAGVVLIGNAIQNVDYLVVGGVLTTTALGYYMLAWNLSSWPINLFSAAVNRVSVPAFARLQHDREASSAAFHQSIQAVVCVTLPFCVLLAALADPVVHFLYGEKWLPAAVALRYLAGVAAVRAATLLATDLLVAGGWGRVTFALQGWWLAILTPALLIGAHLNGIEGVGQAHLAVALFVATPAFVFALHRRGVHARDLGLAMARPVAGALTCGVVAYAATRLPVLDVVQVAIGGLAGTAVYLVIVRPLWAPLLAARRARTEVPTIRWTADSGG